MTKTNRSLERGLALLDILVRRGPNGLAALARHAALPKPTTYRMLLTLAEQGWIYRRHNDGYFVATLPGPRHRGEAALGAAIARLAMPHLLALSEKSGLAADLTWLVEDGVLEVMDSTRLPGIGEVDPKVAGFRPSLAFSAPGRALLAACGEEARARHLLHLMRTDSPAERLALTSGQLAAEILAARQRGYGMRASGYWPNSSDYGREPMDIAVAIELKGLVLGSISLVWPAEERDAGTVARHHLGEMQAAAKKISAAIARMRRA